jgi:hypothetical protein
MPHKTFFIQGIAFLDIDEFCDIAKIAKKVVQFFCSLWIMIVNAQYDYGKAVGGWPNGDG